MTVEELLDQIDDMVEKAWSLPFSGGKGVMDNERLLNIVDDIRGNMPSEIRQARAIVADRTDIVSDAKRESESVIRNAEERARRMVAKEEIVVEAQQRANEILAQAQQQAREMRRGATEFSEDMLIRSEETLANLLTEVRQAKKVLRKPIPKETNIEET